MAKFCISSVSDFGAQVIDQQVRQSLHRRQTNLRSSSPRTSQLKVGLLNLVDFEVPDTEVSRDEIMDWVLDSLRQHYGGPPFVLALDLLPEEYVVVPSTPAVPQS